jgi:hypothetical protein
MPVKNIQNGFQKNPPCPFAPTPLLENGRQKRRNHPIFFVRQITWISQVIAVIFTTGGAVPGHVFLRYVVANKTESHPAASLNHF